VDKTLSEKRHLFEIAVESAFEITEEVDRIYYRYVVTLSCEREWLSS